MKKKFKFRPGIITLTIVSLLFLIISAILFGSALQAIKSGGGGIIGGILVLALFVLTIIVSTILSIIDLPLTIISIRDSDTRTIQIVALIIESIIIIIAITLGILLIINH